MENEGKAAGGIWCFRKVTVHLPTTTHGSIAQGVFLSSAFLRIFCCCPLPQRAHSAQCTDLCLSQGDQIKATHNQSQY